MTSQSLRWGIVKQAPQSTWQEKHRERNTSCRRNSLGCCHGKDQAQGWSNTVCRTKLRIRISSNLGSPWFTAKGAIPFQCGRMSVCSNSTKRHRNATACRGRDFCKTFSFAALGSRGIRRFSAKAPCKNIKCQSQSTPINDGFNEIKFQLLVLRI